MPRAELESATICSASRYSVQLSYRGMLNKHAKYTPFQIDRQGKRPQMSTSKRVVNLNRNNFAGSELGFDDIGHTAHNADLHLVHQFIKRQAGAAQDQVNSFAFQFFELLQNR